MQTRLTKIKAKPGISFDLLNVSLICYQVFFFAEFTVSLECSLDKRTAVYHALSTFFLLLHFCVLMKIHKEEDILSTKIPHILGGAIIVFTVPILFLDIWYLTVGYSNIEKCVSVWAQLLQMSKPRFRS